MWIWPTAFAVSALRNISTFTAFPPSAVNDTHEQWVARVHPEDRERVEKYFLAAVAGSDKEYKAEYRIVRPSDGQTRWIRAVAEIERDAQGRALKLIGAHLDITDQKKAEATVQESEGRLRAITDAIPFLISYLDNDQIFRFINKPYEFVVRTSLECRSSAAMSGMLWDRRCMKLAGLSSSARSPAKAYLTRPISLDRGNSSNRDRACSAPGSGGTHFGPLLRRYGHNGPQTRRKGSVRERRAVSVDRG